MVDGTAGVLRALSVRDDPRSVVDVVGAAWSPPHANTRRANRSQGGPHETLAEVDDVYVEIRILGPVELLHEGLPLRFARQQQRLILGILALEPNSTVPSERVVDLLWPDRPPAQARAVVQSRISELRARMRTHLPAGLVEITNRDGGYVLRVDPNAVDAHRFEHLVAQSKGQSDEHARQTLRHALSLWRGPIMGGSLPEATHRALRIATDSARLTAAEELFDIELRGGNHVEVVDEICALAAEFPSRERLIGQMMLALHRSGRTAEALHGYDRWRRRLADDLGIDPGAAVQSIHLAILKGEAHGSGDMPEIRAEVGSPSPLEEPFRVARPRTLPPDIADFTGRDEQIGRLKTLLTSRQGFAPAIVAVVGQGGIGKTALAVHVAYLVRDQFPDGQLYANLRGADEEDVADPFDTVGRFLRALGVDGASVPETLEERIDLYRGLVSDKRILVVLDNAADDDQIRFLLPGGAFCAVMVTSRARLGATVGAVQVNVGVLDAREATALLSRIAGRERTAAEPAAVADLCRYCGSLPLAVRIAGAKLAVRPYWRVSKLAAMLADERNRLDQFSLGHLDVRASIGLSYQLLEGDVKVLLRRLAHIDLPEASVWLCSALLDVTLNDAEDALEQLIDAQLLDVIGHDVAGYPRCRMHDLVRLFAKERAAADETTASLAATRERVFGAFLFLADSAYQSVNGPGHQDIRGVTARWPVGAAFVEKVMQAPHEWFETERWGMIAAIERATAEQRAGPAWEIICTTSTLFAMRRYFDDWKAALAVAFAAVEAAGDRRGEAALLYRMGMNCTDRTLYGEARVHFERSMRAFQELGDERAVAIVAAFLAMLLRGRGQDDEAMRHYQLALPNLERHGDLVGVGFALRGIGQLYLSAGHLDQAETYLDQALAAYRPSGSKQGVATGLFWLGMLRIRQDRSAEAESAFVEALEITRAIGDRAGEAQCLRGLGLTFQQQGNTELARARLLQALQMVQQPKPTQMELHIRQSLAEVTGEQLPVY